jgi:hypothetical protein
MLNFPNAPIDGELSQQPNGVTYEWQAAKTRWITPIALGQESAAGVVVQTVLADIGTVVACPTQMVYDNTIPQITEGDEVVSVSFTPKYASSKLIVSAIIAGGAAQTAGSTCVIALFDGSADAFASGGLSEPSAQFLHQLTCRGSLMAGTTAPRTISMRAGNSSAEVYFVNGGVPGNQVGGGSCLSGILITEIAQ